MIVDLALLHISLIRSEAVMPLRDVSYILYVDQATSNVSAVSGKVTWSHLSKANGE